MIHVTCSGVISKKHRVLGLTQNHIRHQTFKILKSTPHPMHDLRNRGTTKRTEASPMGDESLNSVANGNIMVARCCILIFLCASRGIHWVLEHPKGSLLQEHVCFQLMMRKIPVFRKYIRMGDYGAETDKGTWLYSGPSHIMSLWFLLFFRSPVHLRSLQETA